MADIILENIYCKEIGVQPKEVRNLKTERDSVRIADCLGKNIEFKTNILNRIKREIEEKIVHKEDNFKYGKTIKFANVTYELGVGGLHSVDQPAIFKADENMRIVDKDVASYYPSIMIVNNLYPEHLSPKFVDILKRITKERLKAKKSGNRIKADSLKIVVNSIFGKLGSDVYWLYDPKQLLSVTVSGQLYLLMLIESLVLEGIEVLSANTDGIVTRIPKHLENKCDEICKWWQNKTGFVLEDTEYVEYYRTDVNNYLVIKPDRKTKEKGRYLKNIDLKKAYRHPIVPKALYNYFVNKISIEETLHSSTDIFEFCISQKVGKDFILEYHANDGITKLQKNNRFYISNDGGKLIKKRIDSDKQIGLYVGENVTILNDYEDSILIDTRNINYEFYINEVNKYILEVEKNEGIEPFCFEDEPEGYISPEHLAEKEREVVINFLKGIKGIPDKLINDLTYINKHFINNKDFLELLVYCEDNSLMSSRFHDLILLGYFHEFGSSKKQMKIYEEFKKGKNRYTRTLSEKSKVKRLEELRLLFDFTSDDEYSILEKIKNEVSVTGNIRSVCNVDKRYAYVQDIDTKYTPKITVYPLSTGKQQVLKVFKKVFNAHPFAIGDILLCKEFKKRNSMRKNDAGEWEEVPDKFDWYLESYYVTKETDEFIVPS
ncbi:MAG TPA: hypothetical protein DC057_02445 [Spirochaetia bacterium]|nr:hypothetical protein [Spirochaetia bacterium]